MANPDKSNTMPERTTFVFGSWACTGNGSSGYPSRLITPKEPEIADKKEDQLADCSGKLDEMATTQASPALDSDCVGNNLAPT